jgi:AcrR family transcriptional regulator
MREALAGEADQRPRATPAAAFRAARRMFLRGERLDMRALTQELGVSRATLYRWTGDREQLLGDVLWSLSDALFEQAKSDHADLAGPERLLAVFEQHVQGLVEAQPLRIFLRQETHAALRVLTAGDGTVQPRTVGTLAELYRAEEAAGHFQPCTDVDTLAYAVVRVTEGFIYNDAIVAVAPELDRALAIVSALLR